MSKYHAKPTVADGIRFSSIYESARYKELKLLLRAGAITDLHMQPKFDLHVNGIKVCTYVGDFLYLDELGNTVLEDAKGVRTPVYRLKKKMMAAEYPWLPITEV